MDACPSRAELAAVVAGTLDPQRQPCLERHLESCADCRERLRSMADASEVVPQGSSARAKRPPSAALEGAMQALTDSGIPDGGVPDGATALGTLPLATDAFGFAAPGPDDRSPRPPFLQPSDDPRFLGKLGPYPIRRQIGRGGMGLVFEGVDPVLHRAVAIKVLAPLTTLSAEARGRFLREARAAAALAHEHVVAIHGVDQVQGTPFLVLQYVEGESLADRLRRSGRMPLAEVVRLGSEVARGLAAAHAKGLIHRDVKPANILLERETGRAKIADFGLAKDLGDTTLTLEGTIAGTPEFMSPEQAASGPVDARTDLFSLGVVLYVASTGVSPFRAPTALLTVERVRDRAPRPVQEVEPSLPTWFCAIVDRLLAKDPRERIESAGALADLLERAVQPPAAQPHAAPSRRPWTPRRVAAVGAGLAIVLAVAVTVYWNRPAAPLAGPAAKPPPASGFVVSGKKTVFASLADAVAAAQNDDVIDVHGDGPYATPPVQTKGKRLLIRAAGHGQPVFFSEGPQAFSMHPLFTTDSELRLEGLTIRWPMAATPGALGRTAAEMLSRCVITSVGGEVALAHCRIVTGRLNGCLGVEGANVTVDNCHFTGDGAFGVFWRPGSGRRLTAANCLFEGRAGLSVVVTEAPTAADASVTLTHNTFAVEKSFQFALFPGPRQGLNVSARGNLFDNAHHCTLIGARRMLEAPQPDDLIEQLRVIAKWSEEGNVHRLGAQYVVALRPGGLMSAEVNSVARWLNLWNLPDTQSIEGNILLRRRSGTSDAEPFVLDRVDTPSGPVPPGIGADPDRVGPGRQAKE